MKKMICAIIPFFVAIITVYLLNSFLDKNIEIMLEKKGLNWASKEYESFYKDKGLLFNNYFADNDYILLQATSELRVPIEEAPKNFFPIKGMNNITTVGVQGWQCITHTEILGSQSTKNNNRKVAIIVSPQWFYYKNGVPPDNFQSSFAPVQFYSFLDNKKISEEHKKQYTSRVKELLRGSVLFLPEKLYAALYSDDDFISQSIKLVFGPYYYARKSMVKLKDKGLLYRKLKVLNDKGDEKVKVVNWDEEFKKAEEEAKNRVTNNEYMVDDEFYNTYKDDFEKQKGYLKVYNILDSKEYDDYELYLNVCKDLGIEPYIILSPTNGKWYDQLGLSKESRDEFYKRARKMAEDKGFEVLDYADKEYTPYFMYDASHFGWEGWLDVDEKLYEHFKN